MQWTGQNNGEIVSSASLLARKCNWLARTSIMNMRNAICVGTQTSKVPTLVTFLFIFYFVLTTSFPGLSWVTANRSTKAWFTCTCRKNRGWLLLADLIEWFLYLCQSNLMLVPYFSVFNIHSHTPEGENPRFLRQVWTRLKTERIIHAEISTYVLIQQCCCMKGELTEYNFLTRSVTGTKFSIFRV